MDIIYSVFTVAFILIIWFNTDAIVEYVTLSRLNLFKVNDYLIHKANDCSITYHAFLLSRYNNFLIRLITCPICLSMWLSFFSTLICDISVINTPLIFIFSNILYFVYTKLSP